MLILRRTAIGLVLAFLVALPATARPWNSTPVGLATNYLQIIDQRSDKEVVAIFWIAPEMYKAEPKNEVA